MTVNINAVADMIQGTSLVATPSKLAVQRRTIPNRLRMYRSVPEMLPKQNCPDPYVKTRAPPEQNWNVIMSHVHSGVRLNPTTNLQRSTLKHGYQVATTKLDKSPSSINAPLWSA